MELVDFNYLYKNGLVTKVIQTGDSFLVARPNPQRGDFYSVLAINQSDLISQIIAQIPPPSLPKSAVQLLGKKLGFDMNSLTDQTITLIGGSVFYVTDVVITNPSISMTIADDFLISTSASRGGGSVAHADNAHGSAIASLVTSNSAISHSSGDFYQFNRQKTTVGNTLYGSLLTTQGSAATADIYVYGYIIN